MKSVSWVLVTAVLAIVLFGVSAVTYLEVVQRPVQDVIALMTLIGAPTIVSLLALAKSEQNGGHIEQVRKQTNGVFTDIQERVANLEDTDPTGKHEGP